MEKTFFQRLCPALLSAALLSAALVSCNDEDTPFTDKKSPYVTAVLDFRPAAGQFTNELPEYEEGDTQEDMNRKALDAIGGNRRGMVSLGGFGGYIVVGFDHTIENKAGLCDFRVTGNAFYAPGQTAYGSSEPGVVQVAYDANGHPDEDEWYEIAGSSHLGRHEAWLGQVSEAGNDTQTVENYAITYHRPETEPSGNVKAYIRWTDNEGASGFLAKNTYHKQPYFPQWIEDTELTLRGTRLPQNGMDLSGEGSNFAHYRFAYGYADNAPNTDDVSAIDIGWAIDAQGQPAGLPGADFIRIYTGVNQQNGWIGECSTEVMGMEDLHLLQVRIESAEVAR